MTNPHLHLAKVFISRYSLGCAVSAACMTGVSLVSILQAGYWTIVSTPAGTIFQCTSLPWTGTRIQFSMLAWVPVGRQFAGKFQTVTYLNSCRYVGLLGHSSFLVSSKQFINHLHSTSTGQLDLLLWTARPDSPTSSSQWLPQMASLNKREWSSLSCFYIRW